MTLITQGYNPNAGISVLGLGGFSVSAVAIFYIILGFIAIKYLARRKQREKRPFYDQEILDDDAPYYHKAYLGHGRLRAYLNNWRGVA